MSVTQRAAGGYSSTGSPLATPGGLLVLARSGGAELVLVDPVGLAPRVVVNISGEAFPGSALAAPPSLDDSGRTVVVALRRLAPGSAAFASAAAGVSVSAATGVAPGGVVWGPVDLGGLVPVADPLCSAGAAVFLGSDGAFSRVAVAGAPGGGERDSAPISGSVPLCAGDPADGVSAPPSLLSDTAGDFLVASQQGCVSAVSAAGELLWTLPRWANASGVVLAAPAGDDGPAGHGARGYWLFTGGAMCCAQAKNGTVCGGWPDQCVELPATGDVLSGLAVAPDSFDWHGGAVYAADAGGTIFAVGAESGRVAASAAGLLAGAARSAPVVVPNAWGADNNALLVLTEGAAGSASAAVSAWQVGSNGAHDDDDAQDDDGYATTGITWQLTLPADLGAVSSRGGVALLPDGSLVAVSDAGELFVVGADRSPIEVDNLFLEVALTAGSVVAGLLLTGVAFFYARRKRIAARLEMEEEERESEKEASDAAGSVVVGLEAPLLSQ